MLALTIVALMALSATMLAIPPIVHAARAWGLLDRPDCARRAHTRPVPRLGGIAVWSGVVVGLAGWVLVAGKIGLPWTVPSWGVGALVGLVLMIAAGLVDDIRDLRPRTKLLMQVLAALVVVVAGFRLDPITLGGGSILSLGWVAMPVTVLWIVAVTNAVNLIDGLDGLAGGITLVALAALSASAVLGGASDVLPVLAALAGGMIGFLRYNRSPARIFLGDVGSLSIGFALSILSIEGARQGGSGGAVAITVSALVLAFPVLDTAIAVLRRWLRGVPLSGADGRHVHHQLVGLGLTHHRAAALICLFASGVAGLGLSITYAPPVITIALSVIGLTAWVLLVIHGTRWLQYHEFLEAQASFSSGFLRARQVIRDRILARDLEGRIRGARTIAEVRRLLDQHRRVLGFDTLVLCDTAGLRLHVDTALRMADCRPRLTFPVTGGAWGTPEGMLIVASWERDTRQPPLYAERVIRIIVPAVEEALARIGATGRQLPSNATPVLPIQGSDLYPSRVAGTSLKSRRKSDAIAQGAS